MEHTTSKLFEIDKKRNDDLDLINQAYGSDSGIPIRKNDLSLDLQPKYAYDFNSWIFQDLNREEFKKVSEDEEENLTK